MIQSTSQTNYNINSVSGTARRNRRIVSQLFSQATTGLTSGELVRDFHAHVAKLPATTPEEKALICSKSQSLKGMRTALTNKGMLKENGTRTCSVSGRPATVYVWVGTALTKLEQLKREKARRENDKRQAEERIEELNSEIALLELSNP